MDLKIVGIAAAVLTSFSFCPQIVKIVNVKSVKDVSIVMLLQFFAGVTLWALYGIFIKDPIIIIANCFTLFTLTVLIALYFYYRKKD